MKPCSVSIPKLDQGTYSVCAPCELDVHGKGFENIPGVFSDYSVLRMEFRIVRFASLTMSVAGQ